MKSSAVVKFFIIALFVQLLSHSLFASQEAPQTFTFDGRAFSDTAATIPLKDNISLRIQILNHNQDCILYEEQQSVNTTTTDGYFTIQVGSVTGSAKRSALDSAHTMAQVYSNTLASISGKLLSNGSACTYNPVNSNVRYVRLQMTPSDSVTRTISPNMALDSVPMANIAERAESIQGLYPTDLILVNNTTSNLTQSNVESIFTATNFARLTSLLSVAPTNYVQTGTNGSIGLPSFAGAPASPVVGQIWYDSSGPGLKYYDGAVKSLGTSGGSVTSVASGAGLLGGTITTTGTLSVDVGTTVGKIVQVQTGGKLPALDGSNLTSLNGSSIASGTIGGTTAISTAGNIQTSGSMTSNINYLYDHAGVGPGYVALKTNADIATAGGTNYTLTFPLNAGSAGQLLSTSGGTGILSWVSPASGVAFSALTPATAVNTIDNLNFAQTWNFSTATTQTPLSLSANALTTGSLLNLSSSSASLNSTVGLLNVTNSSASTTGVLARFQSNSTAGSGLTILGSGNVGIATAAPGSKLEVAGTVQLRGNGASTGLVVNSSGNVGIGSAPFTGGIFDVWSSTDNANGLSVTNQASTGAAQGAVGLCNNNGCFATIGLTSTGFNNVANISTNSLLMNSTSATGMQLASTSATGIIQFLTGTSVSPRMTILNGGNIGIGTIAPAAKLQVGAAPTAVGTYPLFALGTAPFDGVTAGFYTGNTNGTFIGTNAASGYNGDFLNFQTNGVSKFKIDNTGTITSSGSTVSGGNFSTSGNIATTGTGTITSAGQVSANSGAVSTTSTTGALVVAGGEGVTGALNVGGTIATSGGFISNGNIVGSAASAATGAANQSSVLLQMNANYWTGAASAVDQWSIQNILGTGANPTSTLQFNHSGSSGLTQYALMNGNVGIGTVSPSAKLDIRKSVNSNTAETAQYINLYLNATANQTGLTSVGSDTYVDVETYNNSPLGSIYGVRGFVEETSGNQPIQEMIGGYFKAEHETGGMAAYIAGVKAVAKSDNNTTSVVGVDSFVQGYAATNATGFLVSDIDPAGGALTNRYGVKINSFTGTATNDFGLYQAGSAQKNYFAGNVGIGTTGPTEKLSVSYGANADIAIGSATNNKMYIGSYQDSGGISINRRINDGNFANTGLAAASVNLNSASNASSISFNTASANNVLQTERMRVDQNGFVGIGATVPISILHIAAATPIVSIVGTGGANNTVGVNMTPYGARTGGPASQIAAVDDGGASAHMIFSTTATGSGSVMAERMRITDAGNVGIGTAAPSTALDVNGAETLRGIAAPAVSSAGQGRIYFDSTAHTFQVSENGGSFVPLISSGASTGNYSFSGNTLTTGIGDTMTVLPGAAATSTSAGNAMTLQGGPGGTTSGAGGSVAISGGTSTGGSGGTVTLSSSAASGGCCGNGGGASVSLGTAYNSGQGSPISITGGSSGNGYAGASVTLQGGTGTGYGNILLAPTGGNVGIGTAGPLSKLSLGSANVGVGNRVALYESTAAANDFRGIGMANPAAGTYGIGLWTNKTPTDTNMDLFLKDGGSVGIGNVDPQQKLDVSGNVRLNNTISTSGTDLILENAGDTYGTVRLHLQNRNGVNGALFENTALDLVDFAFTPNSLATSNLRLEHRGTAIVNAGNSAGEFQFTRSPGGTADAWFFSGTAAPVVQTGNFGVGNLSPSVKLHVGSAAIGTGVAVAKFQNIDGTCTLTPAAAGSGIACSSDERLKENINDISGMFALDRILKIQAVTYNFKTDQTAKRHTGYLAQALQKIAPEFVRENDDGYLQVYYDGLIPWVTEAIKTLYTRILDMESHQQKLDREIASVQIQKADRSQVEILMTENEKLKKENEKHAQELLELKARLQKIENALRAE